MALNIKNVEVERLVAEVVEVTGESKTEAIRRALAERRARQRFRVSETARREQLLRFLEGEIWSRIPAQQRGSSPSKAERELILGYRDRGI